MFIVDKLLMSPVTGVLWIMKELHKHVQQEQAQESDRLTAKLSELYMLLETNQISSEDFDAQESEILDRLDEIQAKAEAGVEDEDEDEESDEQEENGDDSEENDADDGVEALEDGDSDDEAEDDEDDDDGEDDADEDNVPEVVAEADDSDDIEAMLLAEIESRAKPGVNAQAADVDDSPARKDRNI